MCKEVKNIDYIKSIAILHDLDIEDRIYVAGLVKGLAIKKELQKKNS